MRRRMRAVAAGLLLAVPIALRAQPAPRISPRSYAAIVDARFAGRDGDTTAGAPIYRTLGAALASLSAPGRALVYHGADRAVIHLRNGRYHEKLTIDRPRVTLVGESRDSTVITYDAAAGMRTPDGGTYGTRGSWTLRVVAPDFRAERLTIENAFGYPANAAKPDDDPTKLRDAQAVALMLDAGSDRAAFVDVRILGHQDTLFPNAGRAWFHRCELWGSVDFIFGAGQAVFEECDIVSRDRGSRSNNGYVTAASTPASQPFGFLFLRSRLRKETLRMAANSVTLGRPWHPYGDPEASASVAFVDCWMDDHIGERGWDRMSSVDSTGARVWWEPETARFGERGTTGPGAVRSVRRHVLSAKEAREWTVGKVLRGWKPEG
jgi:pectinesterase